MELNTKWELLSEPEARVACEGCKFYQEDKQSYHRGSCHRYPPIFQGRQPEVNGNQWCGEYIKK